MAKGNWAQRLTEGMDLAGETLPGMSIAELAGDRRVLIEGHKGVTEYCRDRVTVKVGYGWLSICGCGLELRQMSKQQLVISGRIDAIQLRRKCK